MTAGILSAIGNTPLIRLERVLGAVDFELYAKLEGLNPGGSAKDRPAFEILRSAWEEGEIGPGSVVVESSSGNMGIGLAQACRYYGLRFVCIVDSRTEQQNIRILEAYGAEVDVVSDPDPVTGELLQARLARVRHLLETVDGAFWPNQYANRNNSGAHYKSTMREIAAALDGRVDVLFCCISTCGTVRGCADYVHEHGLGTRIVAVDAVGSVILGGPKGPRRIPGLGAGLTPELCDPSSIDDAVYVTDLDCVIGCRRLLAREAVFAGGSSGGAVMGVEKLKATIPNGARCVVILPDRGERYLDTIYSNGWVRDCFGAVSHLWEPPAPKPLPRLEESPR